MEPIIIIGTDIHRHTIEFSKNTRTHFYQQHVVGVSVRQGFKLSSDNQPEANPIPVALNTQSVRRSSYYLVSRPLGG